MRPDDGWLARASAAGVAVSAVCAACAWAGGGSTGGGPPRSIAQRGASVLAMQRVPYLPSDSAPASHLAWPYWCFTFTLLYFIRIHPVNGNSAGP